MHESLQNMCHHLRRKADNEGEQIDADRLCAADTIEALAKMGGVRVREMTLLNIGEAVQELQSLMKEENEAL